MTKRFLAMAALPFRTVAFRGTRTPRRVEIVDPGRFYGPIYPEMRVDGPETAPEPLDHE